jgi:mono/diheme cytochrome c family protein
MIAQSRCRVPSPDAVRRILLGAVLSLMLPAANLLAQAGPGPTQNAASGARVFGTKGCVQCHAVRGLGGGVGPDLGRIEGRRSFFQLAAAMWNHLPSMRKSMEELGVDYPELHAHETDDLIGFLFTLDYFDSHGDVDAGRQLFAEKKCAMCHQVQGAGGVLGPNLDFLAQHSSPMFVAAAMWNHGPGMAETMRTLRIQRAPFTGTEFGNLMSFLESVMDQTPQGPLYVLPGRADVGRELFSEKGCIRCHAVRGAGGQIGPPLGGRGREWSASEFIAAMWNKAPSMQAAMRAGGISVPELTAEEMADLVAYLYSLDYFGESGTPARGRQQLTLKGCLQCHALYGRGGRSASDLGESAGLVTTTEVVTALWNHTVIGMGGGTGEAAEWPAFSAVEMADLVAFLRQLGSTP